MPKLEKAYDPKVLVENFKARGLNLVEEEALVAADVLFAWLDESAQLSATPFDDMLRVAYPKVKEIVKGFADKIDGEVG